MLKIINIIVVFFLILFSINLYAENNKILVLGFESAQLNDVQETLLRNTLLRKLHKSGFDIVPVMKVESIMIKENRLKNIYLGKNNLKNYCLEVGSGYSMIGKIYPTENNKLREIKPGHQFTCDILIYHKKNKEFMNFKFKLKGQDTLLQFYSDITKQVVSNLQNKIKK